MICSSFILRTTSPDQALNVRMRSSICDCKVPQEVSLDYGAKDRGDWGSKFLQAFIFLQVGDVQSKLAEQG